MPDYSKMYSTLFNAQTKAIEILLQAQQETEEMYISAPESSITVLRPDGDDTEPEE